MLPARPFPKLSLEVRALAWSAIDSIRTTPRLTLASVWEALPLSLAMMAGGLTGIPLSDFWWHLRLGQVIWTQRWLGPGDIFSFTTPGAFAPPVQWLGELYLYFVYSLGGLELVLLANALLLAVVVWLIQRAVRVAGGGQRLSAVVTMAFVFACVLPNLDARPQIIGFVVFAFWSLLLVRYLRGLRSPLWLVFPTAVIWNNANGTVIVGAGLLATVWVGEALQARLGARLRLRQAGLRLRGLGLAAASIPAAMLMNPWGLDLFGYLKDYVTDVKMRQLISEWRPPTVDTLWGLLFFALLLTSIGCLALAPRRLDLTELLVFLVFAALAIQAQRNSVWFGIVAAPIVGTRLQSIIDLWPRPIQSPERVGLNYLLAGTLVALTVLALPWFRQSLPLPAGQRQLIDKTTPVTAVEYAASHFPSERFFHPYTYGSYMVWATYGRLPVFIDGRYNHYAPAGVMEDYRRIIQAEDWENALAKYGIRHVMLSLDSGEASSMKPLLREMRRSPGWRAVYEDEHAVIFVAAE